MRHHRHELLMRVIALTCVYGERSRQYHRSRRSGEIDDEEVKKTKKKKTKNCTRTCQGGVFFLNYNIYRERGRKNQKRRRGEEEEVI